MTRQQLWASEALTRIGAVKGAADGVKERRYATLCMQGPTLLQQAGAAQAVSFWYRHDDSEQYLRDLAAVYAKGAGRSAMEKRGFVDFVVGRDNLREYIALTRDLIAAAMWMRRFAQAELKSEES